MKNFLEKWYLSARVVFNLVLISTTAVILSQLFNALFIQHNITIFIPGLFSIFVFPPILPVLMALAVIGLLFFTIPLDRMNHSRTGGLAGLSPQELQRFHSRLSGVPMVIFIINLIGFGVAPFLTAYVVSKMEGTYALDKFLLTWFYTVPVGIVAALWQIEKNNHYLITIKEKLKLTDLHRTPRWYNSFRFKIIMLSVSSLLLIGLLMFDVNHFYIREPNRVVFNEIESRYMTQTQRNELLGAGKYLQLLDRDNSLVAEWEQADWPADVSIPLSDLKAILNESVDVTERRAFGWGLMLIAVLFVAIIRLALVVTAAHLSELKVLTDRMSELVDEGNLGSRLSVINNNEAGLLSSLINQFIEKLQDMVSHIAGVSSAVSDSSKSVEAQVASITSAIDHLQGSSADVTANVQTQAGFIAQSSAEIAHFLSSVSQISDNVTNQASLIEQSSASISEMSAGIESVNKTVAKAENLSAHLKNAAEEGEKSVMSSVSQMQQLVELSNEVTDKVKGISKISAQTNMLAMNAAIEAAHAGESGKGFAVVADEVRSLAEMAAGISKEVINKVKNITELILDGAAVAEESGQAFQSILGDIRANTEVIATISTAVNEQKIGVREVLDSSSSLVMSADQIKDIAHRQKESSEAMRSALQQMIESTEKISSATGVQTEQSSQISSSIEAVVHVSEKNAELSLRLNRLVETFKV